MHKLLLISRNFPPLLGGMENLNWHLADELSRTWRVCCVLPEGAASRKPAAVEKVYEVPLTPLPRFLIQAAWAGTTLARSWRPELVLAGSGLTAPLAWLAARATGARAAAYVHGLDVTLPNRAYRLGWLSFLRRLDGVVANSRATAELARRAGVKASRLRVVYPGVNPRPADPARRRLARRTLGLGERPVLLFIGRLIRRKGLPEFIERALPLVVARFPDCLLLVVGKSPRLALRADPVTPRDVLAAAGRAGLQEHVSLLGTLPGEKLADVVRAADVHVFPVLDLPGDPEGFGMVSLEAAASGVPTVAFAVGGVVEAVEEGISGRLVPSGDWEGFAEAICSFIDSRGRENIAAGCRRFASAFAWDNFGASLHAALESFLAGGG